MKTVDELKEKSIIWGSKLFLYKLKGLCLYNCFQKKLEAWKKCFIKICPESVLLRSVAEKEVDEEDDVHNMYKVERLK